MKDANRHEMSSLPHKVEDRKEKPHSRMPFSTEGDAITWEREQSGKLRVGSPKTP